MGFPGTLPKLSAALKRKGIALQEIGYLLVMHSHPDHAGLAQELKAQGLRLIVLGQQRAAISLLKRHMKPAQHYVEITLHDNLELTTRESRAFLQRIGIAGEIVWTSGHTDDSVSLVLDEGWHSRATCRRQGLSTRLPAQQCSRAGTRCAGSRCTRSTPATRPHAQCLRRLSRCAQTRS